MLSEAYGVNRSALYQPAFCACAACPFGGGMQRGRFPGMRKTQNFTLLIIDNLRLIVNENKRFSGQFQSFGQNHPYRDILSIQRCLASRSGNRREALRTGRMPVPKSMHINSFRFKKLLPYLITALLYPAFAFVSSGSSSGKSLLKLIDALTITGLVFLILGVINSLVRHGDFDIAEYVMRRSLQKGDIKPYEAFRDDKKEKRKDSMNYPFFTALCLLAAAAILTIFVY